MLGPHTMVDNAADLGKETSLDEELDITPEWGD